MNIFLLDGTIVFIFGLYIFLGFKNGVARSLISFIGSIFSLIFSVYISSIVSEYIYDNFIEENLIRSISQILSNKTFSSEDIFYKLPGFVSNALKVYNISNEKILSIIKGTGMDKPEILSSLFSPAIKGIVRNILSILIFGIFMLIINTICRNLSYMFKLPILRQIDRLLGGIFGAFKGYIIIIILMMILKIILPIVKVTPKILSDKNIDSTILFSYMYKNNLIYELYKSINTFIGVGI